MLEFGQSKKRLVGKINTGGKMIFRITVTSGCEVTFAGQSSTSSPVYFGGTPATGLWRINIPKFEAFIASEIQLKSFGTSIEKYVFRFELAELEEWGQWFKKTRDYTSYRPKSKTLISVGQVEWKDVKDLPATTQLEFLGNALLYSIDNAAMAKRKPKDFDHAAFRKAVQESISAYSAGEIEEASNGQLEYSSIV